MKQFVLTPAMGKRLIAKGIVHHPEIKRVMKNGTLVVIAGTTNGYVAEEVLTEIGQADGFSRVGFRRGMTAAPGSEPEQAKLAGDVVIRNGTWEAGATVFDVADELEEGDVVLKGANTLDPNRKAAVQIEDSKGGTILATLPAVVGRRVKLLIPVGLEKRVLEDVDTLADRCNAAGTSGPRLLPMPGETFTELDALTLLSDGAQPCILAAGGVYGAEGSLWIGISGDTKQLKKAESVIDEVKNEPQCRA